MLCGLGAHMIDDSAKWSTAVSQFPKYQNICYVHCSFLLLTQSEQTELQNLFILPNVPFDNIYLKEGSKFWALKLIWDSNDLYPNGTYGRIKRLWYPPFITKLIEDIPRICNLFSTYTILAHFSPRKTALIATKLILRQNCQKTKFATKTG